MKHRPKKISQVLKMQKMYFFGFREKYIKKWHLPAVSGSGYFIAVNNSPLVVIYLDGF